ncbi:PAS domain S-box protein, partial [Streptomyces sp. WAC05292]|uniref:SpoIIE family protein phosphatase n=1 Tax=Streptomyces sp. WAC05292 TaxID=2487418 RepID=UPI000F74762C
MDTKQAASGGPDRPTAAVGYAGVLRELLPIALWREDADGRVVEWSLAAQDLLGHRPEDILGRSGADVLVPDTNRELARQLTRRVQAGETVVGTLPVRHRDGHRVTMEMWIVPAVDRQGRTGALLIAVETSEVLRMRDSLAALQSLFTQSPIGLATLGPDLRFLRVNDALARMNGVSPADHLGKRLTEVVPGVNAAALEATMQQVLERGTAVVDVRRTGRTPADPDHDRTWSCSYAPLLDGSGRALGLIASLIDITDSQQAQLDAERARRRFAVLAEAGTRIGTTLDLRQTAEEIAQVLVPRLADSADVQLLEAVLDEDGAGTHRGVLRRLAAVFPDPGAPTSRLHPGQTFKIPAGTVYEQVIADGRPMNLYRSDIPALIPDPRADALRTYLAGLGSARLIPLVARGTVLGAVTVTRLATREPFDEQDCILIDEVVARAALNIDNARMYTNQRRAALTLQRSLTNSTLPDVSGLELTGRYLPASDHDVGGDWYDAIRLPGGRTGLVIGDVMGHGVHAAAVMGQLRTAVRTLARHGVPPDLLLRSLDAVVADLGADEMATCVYAVHDPASGGCTIARAGHPPPAVATADGRVTF